MSHDAARRQLAQMRARLRLDPANRFLSVEVALTARALRHLERAASAGALEPLPALLAQLAQGQITANTAGQAISRDLSLAAQVAAVALDGAQTGDIQIGEVAGGSIYHIHFGGPPHDPER
jgi:hypothetical protein